MTRFDVIIVGAGSAGCVMASRLSEDPSRRVLLVEAGPVFPIDGYPAALVDGDRFIRTGKYTWGHRSEATDRSPSFDVAAGRVSGGGSTVNAGNIRRGRRDDFDRWAAMGIPGWSYEDVLGTYIRIENTPDGDDVHHGRTGPLPVRHLQPGQATPTIRAFVESCVEAGFDEIADVDSDGQRGVTLGERNVVDGVKINTGIAYLTAGVRARPNLTIQDKTPVDRVEFDRRRAVGVRLVNGKIARASEIILCAGAYGSPGVLMRSGIGPANHLSDMGIDVIADLPVGDGLRDHPAFFKPYRLKRDIRDVHPAGGSVLALSSAEAVDGDLDLWVFAYNMMLPPGLFGRPAVMLGAAVMRPLSRGTIRLRSCDPRQRPIIDFNLLAEPADRRRMVEAVRLARHIADTPPLSNLIDHELSPGPDPADAAALLAEIHAQPMTFDHGCGTARMGADGDPGAVTDARGRVRTVDGLRVVDASIFPDTLSVPINLSTIMVAERIAAEIATF